MKLVKECVAKSRPSFFADLAYMAQIRQNQSTSLQFQLKVALFQKVLMHLSFPQTDEPYYFPELEF